MVVIEHDDPEGGRKKFHGTFIVLSVRCAGPEDALEANVGEWFVELKPMRARGQWFPFVVVEAGSDGDVPRGTLFFLCGPGFPVAVTMTVVEKGGRR